MYSRVYVEITHICNMSCSFCHGHSRPPRRMSEDEFSRVLDALEGQTEYVYLHLMGEPLTHPSLPAFMKTARERGFKPMITTNGTLLSSRGGDLLTCGLHKINVSLHSFEGDSEQKQLRYLSDVTDFAAAAADAGVIVVSEEDGKISYAFEGQLERGIDEEKLLRILGQYYSAKKKNKNKKKKKRA